MVDSHGAIRVAVYRKDITWGKAVLFKSAFKWRAGGGGVTVFIFYNEFDNW